jgi:2-hydroxymuconate-semialdehyde hydrolase
MLGKTITVDGIRTHYFEMGRGPALVLLHSGEFGGCAELSWEHSIAELAKHFRVLAPDWLGFGKTEKLFSFENMRKKRVDHIAAFLRALDVSSAHFVGNSMGGTMLLEVAATPAPPWPIERVVAVCGGGDIPDNEARRVLNTYDGSREHMQRMIESMFISERIRNDEDYIDRRHRISLEPGAWECAAAVRLNMPTRQKTGGPRDPDYANIKVPVLIVAGEKDPLRLPNYGPTLHARIPGAALHVIRDAGHCPHLEFPDEFNRVVIEFLTRA